MRSLNLNYNKPSAAGNGSISIPTNDRHVLNGPLKQECSTSSTNNPLASTIKCDGEDLPDVAFKQISPARRGSDMANADNLDAAPAVQCFSGSESRTLDVVLSLAALLLLAPLMLLIALTIKLADGGPALFRQDRIGFGGRGFGCFKFRSMAVDAPQRLAALLQQSPAALAEWQATQKLKNDPRITPIGSFLRKSSLDELPQLLNVLRGEMALVGPRPIVAAEIARYGAAFDFYCAVPPGITGLWQISGRSDTGYAERVALDTAYVQNKCLAEDIKILFKTIPAVLFQRGSY